MLAARIAVDNLHKSTSKSFSETSKMLYNFVEPKTGLAAPLLSEDVFQVGIDGVRLCLLRDGLSFLIFSCVCVCV